MAEVETMRYHGPGWDLGDDFQLWAPQDGAISDPHGYAELQQRTEPTFRPRTQWAAHWDEHGHWRGTSADEVLAHFPAEVAAKFRTAIEAAK